MSRSKSGYVHWKVAHKELSGLQIRFSSSDKGKFTGLLKSQGKNFAINYLKKKCDFKCAVFGDL
jgi:hypothetical protein